MNALNSFLKNISKYPSAVFGLIIILALVFAAIYVLITIPYNEAITKWRGGEEVWYQNPKHAPPTWVNFFRKEKLAESFSMTQDDEQVTREEDVRDEKTTRIILTYPFEYLADTYPQDLAIYFTSTYAAKQPFISLRWLTPDGREIRVSDFAISQKQTYRFVQDNKLKKTLGRRKR